MKIREIRLQNGIFVYKVGISFTKWDFHLQRGTLALQTGLSFYISPIQITDDDILTAIMNGLYVSAFISRQGDAYNVHFLVHAYPENMKSQFDEEILKEVLRYMIMMTIVRLRLDTPEKVEEYLGSGDVDSCK